MANVTEMPAQEAPVSEDIPPENEPATQTSVSKRPPMKPGRPGKPNLDPNPSFFKKVGAIASEDWGTRAFMYLYIDEPVCVEKTWGQYSYAMKFKQPILDLEPIKERYGSCKGWLSLNTRKSGKDATDQIDRYDFEIWDPPSPPKVPKAAWANDSRNDRWRALLPPEPPPKAEATANILETMRVIKEIKQEVRDDMPAPAEPAPPADPTRATLETLRVAKDLFAPAAQAAPAIDPFDTAKKVMDMRANDPMITLLLQRMESQDKAMEAARQREHELLKELRDNKPQTQAAPAKGMFEQLIEFGGEAIKTRLVNSLFGGATAAATETVRAGRTGWLDILDNNAGKLFDMLTPLAQAAALKMTNTPNGNGNGHAAMPQNRPTTPATSPDANFGQFIQQVVNPKMLMFFTANPTEEGGMAFADWMYAGFPEYFERLQNFTHPMLIGMKGQQAIVTAYRNTPDIWPHIAPKEAEFVVFVKGFCEFDPNEEGDDAPPAPADPSIQDADFIDIEEPGRVS